MASTDAGTRVASFIAEDDAAVAAAHRRLGEHAAALRTEWQRVRTGCRNAMTSPTTIGGFAIAGALLGARGRSRATSVQCRCIGAKPSLLWLTVLALVTPLPQEVLARALTHPVTGADPPPAAPQPPSASTPAPTGFGA